MECQHDRASLLVGERRILRNDIDPRRRRLQLEPWYIVDHKRWLHLYPLPISILFYGTVDSIDTVSYR